MVPQRMDRVLTVSVKTSPSSSSSIACSGNSEGGRGCIGDAGLEKFQCTLLGLGDDFELEENGAVCDPGVEGAN